MKVYLVNGSPHQHGCTYTALKEVAITLESENIQTDIYWIKNSPISGCIGCRACTKLNRCVFEDSVNKFRDLINDADGFVFGTPVHYASAAGNMSSFMDRLFYSELRNGNDKFRLKPAAVVLSARRAGTTSTYDQMIKHLAIHEMPIVSSRYWNMVHGSNPDDVLKDEEGLQTMRILARNMAYLLKCIDLGRTNHIQLPEREKTVFTNFIR